MKDGTEDDYLKQDVSNDETVNTFISDVDYQTCLNVLQKLINDPNSVEVNNNHNQIFRASTAFYKVVKKNRKKRSRLENQTSSKTIQSRHEASSSRDAHPVKSSLNDEDLIQQSNTSTFNFTSIKCYCCNQYLTTAHHRYDSMCEACGKLNEDKRHSRVDLTGRIAVVTGGRVKLGFAVAQHLLRCGAQVVVTTRFPHDAAKRFAQCPDFETWQNQLKIYPLDLRSVHQINAFTDWMSQHHSYLDILINNAAQTIRRPPSFYAHLMDVERTPVEQLSAELQPLIVSPTLDDFNPPHPAAMIEHEQHYMKLELTPAAHSPERLSPAELSQVPLLKSDTLNGQRSFPHNQVDEDGQQLDLRSHNSWMMRLRDVPLPELIEVQMINTMAPFILLQSLEPLLEREIHPHRFVINVTAREGNFKTGRSKSSRHPHTNMSKAALNMLTHTISGEFKAKGIFVNSVDPGWLSLEFPYPIQQKYKQNQFQLPLDYIDGAARVCDPIFEGIKTGEPTHGRLFKDYQASSWGKGY